MGAQECTVDLTKIFVVQAVTERHSVFQGQGQGIII